jgi:hypothetical protein
MTSHGYKQNEISQELSMGTKIFKTSYYTVLRAFSFKRIKILMTVPLENLDIPCLATKKYVSQQMGCIVYRTLAPMASFSCGYFLIFRAQ